jgi:anti-sigma B factor antagonist
LPAQVTATPKGGAGQADVSERDAGALRGRRADRDTLSEDSVLPPDFSPKPFACASDRRGDTIHLRPAGELDMASVPLLEARLRDALDGGGRRLVLDLRELDFMDSTGLTLLARWSLGARQDGYALALVPGGERIQRLFELTGMAPHFDFVDG